MLKILCSLVFFIGLAFASPLASMPNYCSTKEPENYNTSMRLADLTVQKWPNGIVHYTFDQFSGYTSEDQMKMRQAMDKIEEQTGKCIQFKPRTFETDYIQIKNVPGQGCTSQVGKQSIQPQIVTFEKGCIDWIGVMIHEYLHALGFQHEHVRADRDFYINVHWDNIQPSAKWLYNVVPHTDPFGQPLDFDSVMMYLWNFNAIDGNQPTLSSKLSWIDLKAKYLTSGGSRKDMSPGDVYRLKRFYNCP